MYTHNGHPLKTTRKGTTDKKRYSNKTTKLQVIISNIVYINITIIIVSHMLLN